MEASAPAGGFVNTGDQKKRARSCLTESQSIQPARMGDENVDDAERTWTAVGQGQHAVHLRRCLQVTHAAQKNLADVPDEALMRPGFTDATCATRPYTRMHRSPQTPHSQCLGGLLLLFVFFFILKD